MIQITTEELKTGHVLAKSIYRENGDLLLRAGFKIDDKVLPKIHQLNYPAFWIEEEGTESIEIDEVLDLQIQLQSREALSRHVEVVEQMKKTSKLTINNIHEHMSKDGQFKNVIMPEEILENVKNIMIAISKQDEAMVNLNSLRTKNNHLFQHALDVTATAIFLGNRIFLPSKDIEELAVGCMLKDIGQVVLPDELLQKKGPYTAEEKQIIKEHTTFGYTILKENRGLPLTSAHVALQHHENQDGSGYPRGLTGTNELPPVKPEARKNGIHRYAEITAVAEAYIGLISPAPWEDPPLSPGDAIKILIGMAGKTLNRSLVKELITSVPIFPVGARIKVVKSKEPELIDNIGIVTDYHRDASTRPSIVVLFDKNKKKIKPRNLDLRHATDVEIIFQVLTRKQS